MIVWISFLAVIVIYCLIKMLYKKLWDKNLNIEVSLPEVNVHEGDTASIKEVITNDKFLPLPILEIFFNLDKGLKYIDMSNSAVSDKLYRRDVFSVGAKRKISRTFDIQCIKRGYYTLDKLEMMSSDMFMSQKFLQKKEFFTDFYVYPKRVRSDKLAVPYKKIMGDMLVKKTLFEDPFSFAGIRDYAPGDPMSRINWKATAKSQGLVVNMCDSSINQKIVIFLDTYEHQSLFADDLCEESIRITSALVERLFVEGVEVTVQSNARDILSKETLSLNELKGLGVDIIKQKLARLEKGYEEPITTMFDKLSRDTYVVIVSKNQNLQKELKDYFDDFFWIVPYKGERPEFSNMKSMYFPWELNTNNINKNNK